MKIIFKTVLILGILIGGYIFLSMNNILPMVDMFESEENKLRETPLILEDIKDIDELFTVTAYEEIFIDTTKKAEKSTFTLNKKHERFVLIVRGKCLAGTDLKEITDKDLIIKDSSITVRIPKAKIISTIVNPSDFDIYIEEGEWKTSEVTKIKKYAVKRIEANVVKDGILIKAQDRTNLLLKNFFESIGFVNVTIEIK
jgi:hypothetical protein